VTRNNVTLLGDALVVHKTTSSITFEDYTAALRIRAHATAIMRELFDRVDVLALPSKCQNIVCESHFQTATPTTAPKLNPVRLDISEVEEAIRFAGIANLVGLPAISLPSGYDSNRLPIGFQLIADHWNENTLFSIAHVAESMVEKRKPSFEN
jgi:Asp-tRNA(Asn)/Glu-tRNA(Gln) amidotransferase A subunit family amidase